MKTTGAYKIWRIVYPIGIYYVVSSIAYFFLTLLLGAGEESYMLRQMLCAVATIPFVWMHYGQDRAAREIVYGRRGIRPDARFFCTVAGSLFAGASLGMAVNNVIVMTPLIETSAGFQSANQAFFAGGVVFELLGSCLMIPLAEELLYRGVVERRLSLLCGSVPAIVLSAVIFGVMHWNVVQFLYAGILVSVEVQLLTVIASCGMLNDVNGGIPGPFSIAGRRVTVSWTIVRTVTAIHRYAGF